MINESDALSYELKKFNIQVSVIEPGNYKSNMGEGNDEKFFKLLLLENNPYKEEIETIKKRYEEFDENVLPIGVDVAEAVYHELFDANPYIRFTINSDRDKPLKRPYFTKIIAKLLQINQYQDPYSLEEILEFIKEQYKGDFKKQHFVFLPEWAQNKN